MLVVGEDPKKFINQFSNEFKSDFLQLLRTGHGEKQVHINHFYQEYIANKVSLPRLPKAPKPL
jgi:DNA/RNA-binding protein KIN17